jgi:transcriptional accessory protein Tex/SPT6
MQGKVSWIEAYGAFVDIALADGRTVSGLIHKSELSWSMVNIPETVVSIGALAPHACAPACPSVHSVALPDPLQCWPHR